MSYVVSARKYRPQLFEELIGQNHIALTLKNAIAKNRTGHAYLFSGPRGVGKTSAARIFAKALNCEQGPTPTPCNKCTFCTEITEGRALDLVEIDGASNRRIDEVRQLRENVRFVPSAARYKIYIIDEVHMLTTEAFNALLKTLEEPPRHIFFIFATTEVNKVPDTIRSRCQQFVFKRIPIPLIIEALKRILEDFQMEAEEEALFWIAKGASGSMRDAQSILDQMISYSDNLIKKEDVFYVLGEPLFEIYHTFAEAIAQEDIKTCFLLLDKLLDDGVEVKVLLSGMIDYYRNLYALSVDEETSHLIELPGEDIERMKSISQGYTQHDIHNILILLSKLYLDIKNNELARQFFEITLMKLARYKEIIHPASLIQKLEKLKQGIEEGGIPPSDSIEKKQTSLFQDIQQDQRPSDQQSSEKKTDDGDRKENADRLMQDIINHFSKKRRTIAEFFKRAKGSSYENNILTVQYDKKQRWSFEHVSEDPTKRYIEKEVKDLLRKEMRIDFVLIDDPKDVKEEISVSPNITKVLEIFKGEIVPNNNAGGI